MVLSLTISLTMTVSGPSHERSLFQCYAVNLVKGFSRKGRKSFYSNNLKRGYLHQGNIHITEIPTKKSGPVVLDYILKKAR